MYRLFSLLTVFLFALSLAYGGDVKRKGTAGAQEVLIPVGARGIATGGALFPSLSGVEAIYYNPAGLSVGDRSEAMFSHMSYIADINVSYVAVSANFVDFGAIALSFKTLSFGDIPVTTFEHPDGDGTTYSPGTYIVGLTYSRALTDRVSAGFTTKVIYESVMSTSASGMAIDFGVQYRFSSGLSIGASLKNVGTDMQFSGSDLQTKTDVPEAGLGSSQGVYSPETESFQIPSYFELGVNYLHTFNPDNQLLLGTTFRNNNNLQDELMFGLEYKMMNVLALRSGYDMLVRDAKESVYGLNLGAGVDYKFENGIAVSFDYAFRSVKDFPTDNHVFTVKLGL
jgi:opacity protein-like surface antigen